ncbi:hypothetical protein [Sphingobium sp. Z007]|uniref:hypothetical protein n=1 Tax=Sphingobium sp. Z007 TaxID=627495 RepID=UPI000B49F094|nr:hypothetical protein [Sphingobium sp. Z007]
MSFFLADLAGLLLGVLLGLGLILLPGIGIARLMERAGLDSGRGWPRIAWGLILAFALLPAIDALLVRRLGLPAMVVLHGVLALYGLAGWRMWRVRLTTPLLWPVLLWLCIVIFDSVDLPMGGRLNQSLLYIDLVKHAATTHAIMRDGLPFHDPFFARPGGVGYYYYFYLWPAAIEWMGGTVISARMAFTAALFWAGLALPAALWRVGRDAGLIRAGRERAFIALIALFCFTSGVDLIMMALRFAATGVVEAQSDWWNTAVGFAVYSALGVPHHLTAMIAAWTALLLLSSAQDRRGRQAAALSIAAGLAVATCFGSSVWVMLTIAPVLVGWGCLSLWRRNPTVAIAGVAALLAALVQIADLLHFRQDAGFPIALTVRPFTLLIPEGGWWSLLHAALLPVNYGIEFGIFAWGAIAWWRRSDRPASTLMGRLLLTNALCALFIATFLKSTILNNDLAWRSIWFVQFAAMLWTAAELQGPTGRLRDRRWGVKAALALGIAAVLWDVVGLRLIRPPYVATSYGALIANRPDDDDQRAVYEWATRHLPTQAVIQHNPALHRRMFNFGLYGTHRTAVADREANLFGASAADVAARIATLAPIYAQPVAPSDIARRARHVGVDYLLFTASDPVWSQSKGPPPAMRCVYRQPSACLVRVRDIQP